jgi:HEAT repeat protein
MPKGEHLKRIPKETRLKNLGVKPLGPGEASQLLQVRGAAEVVQALKALSPEERGRVATLGLEALKRGVEDPEALAQALEDLEAFRELWGRLPWPVRWILARVWG